MECLLDGKNARALDRALKAIALSGDVSMCARPSGVLFQTMCADKSALSELFVGTGLFQEYSAQGALQISFGRIDFYRAEMESLLITASDAAMRLEWKKKDVTERRIIYVSPPRLREIEMTVVERIAVSPGAMLAALRAMKGVEGVLIIIEEDEILIRNTSSSGFICDVRFGAESRVKRAVSVSRAILKKALSSATTHDRAALELGEEDEPIRFVFESLEWSASMTIATMAL
jgi:hypothetical protein